MRKSRASEQGMSLIAMLVLVILIAGLATALLLMAATEHRATEIAKYKLRATYLAEAAVEQAAHLIRTGYANEFLPPPQAGGTGKLSISGVALNYAWDKSVTPYRYSLSSAVVIDGKAIDFAATEYRVVPPPMISGQLSTTKVLFEIKVSTQYQQALGMVIRNVEVDVTPLFQFLAFYNGDLEFLPGPAWVGRGRVHTNGNLHIGAGTSLDLDTDYVRAVGQMYRHRKDNGASMAGPVRVRDASGNMVAWDTALESTDVFGSNPSSWANQALSNWGGNVKNGAMGAVPVETPDMGSVLPPTSYDPNGGMFYQKAKSDGLVIAADASGNVTASYKGTDVTSALTSSGALNSRQQVFDARQSRSNSTPVTKIDMGKLKTSGYYPGNGVLYVYDQRNPTPSTPGGSVTPPETPAGFVFQNAAELPQANGALTIASNGPVYIQGDFNANPKNASYVKQPAAVIADAINLLSNSWNDTKGPSNMGANGPRASETTYNFAMVTGNVPTPGVGSANNPKDYSGGLENLPRFHEDWSGGVKCHYNGSMVNLWKSQLSTGKWGQGGVYSPPSRDWNFDQDFVDPQKPKPPAFPMGVSIGRTTYEERYR